MFTLYRLTWTGVGTTQLPEMSQPLPPLLDLLVAVVVLPRLLGEVGEHGGQGPPADLVWLRLAASVAADGGKFTNSLEYCWSEKPIPVTFKICKYLQQSGVGVASVTSWKQIFKIFFTQDELNSSYIVWVCRSFWRYVFNFIIVKSLYSG